MRGDFAQTFEERLAALGRANSAVSLGGSVDLARLLAEELKGACDDLSGFSLKGPPVAIGQDCALALGLLFHELGCNATQHGSLSLPGGRVDVSWRAENGMLGLTWVETGGPPVQRPSSHGMGNLLIKHTAAKLEGTANLLYLPAGFRCELRVSLSACWPDRRAALLLVGRDAVSAPLDRYGLQLIS